VVDSERAGQTLLENDPNSKYPKCQVFDLSIESNDLTSILIFLLILHYCTLLPARYTGLNLKNHTFPETPTQGGGSPKI